VNIKKVGTALPSADSITVRATVPGDADKWDAYLGRHSDLPPLGDYAWGEIMSKVFQSDLIRLIAEDESQRIRAVSAVYPTQGNSGRAVLYSLDRCFVAETETAEAALIAALRDIGETFKAEGVYISTTKAPFSGPKEEATRQAIVLPIASDEDEAWGALRAKTRNMIRKAEKQNIEIEVGLGNLRAFYEIYAERMLDMGVPIYDYALFEAMAEVLSSRIDLFVARQKGEIIGGLFLLYGDQTGTYPFQATAKPYLGSAATQLLIWRAARACAKRGLSRLDMGISSSGSPVHKSKINFGGKPEDVHHLLIETNATRGTTSRPTPLARRIQHRLANETMKRGPLWLKRPVGLWLKRQGRLLF
jgi:hypothetical protein